MALSANTSLQMANTHVASRRTAVIKTGAKIYKHAIVCLAAGVTGNPAVVAANSTTQRYLGIAADECLTGNGTRTVTVLDGPGLEVLMVLKTGVTKGHIGDAMYAYDDATVTQQTTLGPQIGVLTKWVSATSGWVALRTGAMSDAT